MSLAESKNIKWRISLTTDILLVNVPRISLVYPPAGTSLLKGICEQQGFTCTVKDANFELLDSIKDADDFENITNYFTIPNAEITPRCQNIIDTWYKELVDYIVDVNPRHVCISVFTFECQVATRELCELLKQVYKGKIIIGGED